MGPTSSLRTLHEPNRRPAAAPRAVLGLLVSCALSSALTGCCSKSGTFCDELLGLKHAPTWMPPAPGAPASSTAAASNVERDAPEGEPGGEPAMPVAMLGLTAMSVGVHMASQSGVAGRNAREAADDVHRAGLSCASQPLPGDPCARLELEAGRHVGFHRAASAIFVVGGANVTSIVQHQLLPDRLRDVDIQPWFGADANGLAVAKKF